MLNIKYHTTTLNHKKKSADFRHTLSWLTTSHNPIRESLHYWCILSIGMLFCSFLFRGGDSDSIEQIFSNVLRWFLSNTLANITQKRRNI